MTKPRISPQDWVLAPCTWMSTSMRRELDTGTTEIFKIDDVDLIKVEDRHHLAPGATHPLTALVDGPGPLRHQVDIHDRHGGLNVLYGQRPGFTVVMDRNTDFRGEDAPYTYVRPVSRRSYQGHRISHWTL